LIFSIFHPTEALKDYIACYWLIDNPDPLVRKEKIIPDGFPEIIIHYGDPFRINIDGTWKSQSLYLLAGQIRNHFYLENTGITGMWGIKMRPAAITEIFNVSMQSLVDTVVPFEEMVSCDIQEMTGYIHQHKTAESIVQYLDSWFLNQLPGRGEYQCRINEIIKKIFSVNGMVTIKELSETSNISERQIERYFRKYIGLTPKFFCRIIRFNYLFDLMKKEDKRWTTLAYESGFFDQSHFIKDFKAFTGEDPSKYLFDQKNMANFFLKRKK